MQKIYYGEQTKNALDNFISSSLNFDFIKAFAEVKKATISAIQEYNGYFKQEIFDCIIEAINKIIYGELNSNFVLSLQQGGAGTSINMNFCEVIANFSKELYKEKYNEEVNIDPLEDINRYQSTNDLFPTAVTIVVYRHLIEIENLVIKLQEALVKKETEYSNILITGRTELQSALPITLGQVFGGWAGSIERDRWRLNKLKERIKTIALGGTALGTCFFAPQEYIFIAERKLREITGLPLCRSQNLVDEISNLDKYVELSNGYKTLANNLFKITGDLLLYTSSFINEIKHPHLQYGSTIMAAKVNPVILEFVRGLAIEIEGECYKIEQYAKIGQLQLNAFLPFVIDCFIKIYSYIKLAINSFINKFLNRMEINNEKIEKNLLNSNILLNSLIPELGYNEVKRLFILAQDLEIRTIEEFKEFVIKNSTLNREKIDKLIDPIVLTSSLK
ncbi:MAG TPA: lyase family protein [Spirochaetota bacterium]|nr:lyase family protein [Spirochaetota bacterium]HOL57495.1 lyase family protein [Spirochaetota bacterium]HPP04426.1 lyase family protein [Spirochaetota bacterium]